MRFLIVAPRYVQRVGQYYNFPLGLAYISSSLKKYGYYVRCLNLNHYGEHIDVLLEREIKNHDIDVVCTGGLAVHFKKVKDIFDAARKVRRGIKTVIGGGLLSSDPELIMNALKPDVGIIGEGEITIVELADAMTTSKELSTVKGLVYFDSNNNVITNASQSPIKDIGTITYPDYDGFEFDKYLNEQLPSDEHYLYLFDKPRAIPMVLSRSCPYSCTFCYHPLGKKYRQRPLDDFFRELDYLIEKYNVNMVLVLDELFSIRKGRIYDFCERMKKYSLKWTVQLRVDRIDAQMLTTLKDAGCFLISYGLESASEHILKSMKKHITLSQIEKALQLTHDRGIAIQGNFIFGDKEETWKTANDTLRWWRTHRTYQVNLTRVCAYPGTELYKHAMDTGAIKDRVGFLEKGCPPVNATKMHDDEYDELIALLSLYNRTNPVPAQVRSCSQEGKDIYKGKLYSIEVRCPHCRKTVKYRNLHGSCNKMFKLGCRLRCRECNKQMDILPFPFHELTAGLDADRFREAVNIVRNYKTVAIYGAGTRGEDIYRLCIKNGKKVLYFADNAREGTCCGLDVIRTGKVVTYPDPDITIFASASSTFQDNFIFPISNRMLWNTEIHSEIKTLLYTPLAKGAMECDIWGVLEMHYLAYYVNYWLPLLRKYFPDDNKMSEPRTASDASFYYDNETVINVRGTV